MQLPLHDLRATFGFGVAGNFAGHLEQAGEAADFVTVQAPTAAAPKGIFPWYVPGEDGFLGVFPLSHDTTAKPSPAQDGAPVNLQIEPEAGVLCTVSYDTHGHVTRLTPAALGAFNDCSVRRPGAAKISHKKNWGASSKGMARTCFPVTDLSPEGPTAALRLACFLRRDGEAHAYGVDSALSDYSYYGDQLLEWTVDRLNHQAGADGTPLEDVGALLRAAGHPATVLIGIGATRYTSFGAQTYLDPGDESLVLVYDSAVTPPDAVRQAVHDGREDTLAGASILRQRVTALTAG
jgi:hypothetical protein